MDSACGHVDSGQLWTLTWKAEVLLLSTFVSERTGHVDMLTDQLLTLTWKAEVFLLSTFVSERTGHVDMLTLINY